MNSTVWGSEDRIWQPLKLKLLQVHIKHKAAQSCWSPFCPQAVRPWISCLIICRLWAAPPRRCHSTFNQWVYSILCTDLVHVSQVDFRLCVWFVLNIQSLNQSVVLLSRSPAPDLLLFAHSFCFQLSLKTTIPRILSSSVTSCCFLCPCSPSSPTWAS